MRWLLPRCWRLFCCGTRWINGWVPRCRSSRCSVRSRRPSGLADSGRQSSCPSWDTPRVTTCSSNLDAVSTSTILAIWSGWSRTSLPVPSSSRFGEAARRAQHARKRAHANCCGSRCTASAMPSSPPTSEGRVTYMNAVAESLTGWTQTEAIGRPLDDGVSHHQRGHASAGRKPGAKGAPRGSRRRSGESHAADSKGRRRVPIDDSAAPIRDETRYRSSGCVLIFAMSRRSGGRSGNKASQLLAARLLASIIESSDDAIISKSLDGVIQSWNAGAERLFGYTAEEAVGRHISLVIPPDRLGRGRRHHRQPESRTADRTLRNRAPAIRRLPHLRLAHDLARSRTRRALSSARRRSSGT